MFISFEGGDGAGKTTQIKKLAANLIQRGHDVVLTREPGGTEDAEALWQVFLDRKGHHWDVLAQALLVFTTRRLHVENLIKPALQAGKIVITDRFTDSTRMYQGLAGGLGLDKVERLKAFTIGSFEPDLTLIFDIDPQIGLGRGAGKGRARDNFEEKDLTFHEALRQGYLDIARKFPQRCHVINAARDMDAVEKDVLDICLKILN